MFLTLLSGIFGGLLRLAPELLKWLDRKDDRAHELAMQDKQMEFLKLQGTMRVDEIQTQGNVDATIDQIKAIVEVNKTQSDMAVAGGKFAAGVSALVRPIVTFYIFLLWGVHKAAVSLYAYNATRDLVDTLVNAWTADDGALLSMIAAFWFVGRVLDKQGK